MPWPTTAITAKPIIRKKTSVMGQPAFTKRPGESRNRVYPLAFRTL
jgi:hypothetical protein